MTPRRALTLAAALALPAEAFAAQTIIQLSESIQRTVYKPLSAAIIGFALLLFVWGIYRYIAQSGDEGKASEGAKMMSYGILVLFVMFSVWGLVRLGLSFFGFGEVGNPSGSVFGVEARDYDSGLNYQPVDPEDIDYDRRGYRP